MRDKEIWDLLISKAKEVRNPRVISPFIEAGQVGVAILTKSGNIYTGVCIDTASTLGICAERNAIARLNIKKRRISASFLLHFSHCCIYPLFTGSHRADGILQQLVQLPTKHLRTFFDHIP